MGSEKLLWPFWIHFYEIKQVLEGLREEMLFYSKCQIFKRVLQRLRRQCTWNKHVDRPRLKVFVPVPNGHSWSQGEKPAATESHKTQSFVMLLSFFSKPLYTQKCLWNNYCKSCLLSHLCTPCRLLHEVGVLGGCQLRTVLPDGVIDTVQPFDKHFGPRYRSGKITES